MLNIVLFNPEIPQNTGNIARTCAATGAKLHLIKPLGFSLEDRYLKRAGLDYWSMTTFVVYEDFEDFIFKNPGANLYLLSTKADKNYCEVEYKEDDFLVFGCETRGLPEDMLKKMYLNCIRIPMIDGARSLNLSNSVAIVLYEALRCQNFKGLCSKGELTGRQEDAHPWLDYI